MTNTPSPVELKLREFHDAESAKRERAPEMEGLAYDQRPKTSDHGEVTLYRYVGTDLYQWYSTRGVSVFSDPFGLPFVIRPITRPDDGVRAALEELTTIVRGECPRLLEEDSGGDGALSLRIDDLISTVAHPKPQPAKLADVLEPFATFAEQVRRDLPDSTIVECRINGVAVYHLALGSLRAAHDALSNPSGGRDD